MNGWMQKRANKKCYNPTSRFHFFTLLIEVDEVEVMMVCGRNEQKSLFIWNFLTGLYKWSNGLFGGIEMTFNFCRLVFSFSRLSSPLNCTQHDDKFCLHLFTHDGHNLLNCTFICNDRFFTPVKTKKIKFAINASQLKFSEVWPTSERSTLTVTCTIHASTW